MTVRGERSRWFGPDGSYYQGGNDVTANNLDSDFFFQQIKDSGAIQHLLSLKAPLGPKPEVRQPCAATSAGYNRYLHDIGGSAGVPDPTCRGKAWVRPISEMDAYLRFYQLVELASGDVAIDGIAEAQPPTAGAVAARRPARSAADRAEPHQQAAAHGRDRQQRRGGGERRDARPQARPAARQPALPLDRAGALLPGAAHDSRQGERGGRVAVRRAGDPDRAHAVARLEPHRLHGVPLHALPAHARAGLTRRRTSTTASRSR